MDLFYGIFNKIVAVITTVIIATGFFGQPEIKEIKSSVPAKTKVVDMVIKVDTKGTLEQRLELRKDKELEQLKREIEGLKRAAISSKNESIKIEKPELVPKEVEGQLRLIRSEIIKRVIPAVVYIETDGSSGSGVLIDGDGLILTNAHVVGSSGIARVELADGRVLEGFVIGKDGNYDLALIKIHGGSFPSVSLGDSDENFLKQGDDIFAFGYPFGLRGKPSFKEGTVSRRQKYQAITYIETSTEIHPGNSGGPLANERGEIIGINTLMVGQKGTDGDKIKLAIPINLVKEILQDLKSGRNISGPAILISKDPAKNIDEYTRRLNNRNMVITFFEERFKEINEIFVGISSQLVTLGGFSSGLTTSYIDSLFKDYAGIINDGLNSTQAKVSKLIQHVENIITKLKGFDGIDDTERDALLEEVSKIRQITQGHRQSLESYRYQYEDMINLYYKKQ